MADTIPKTTLSAVNGESIFRASYQGECVTLSPSMTLEEFRSEIVKLEALIHRAANERAKREATHSAERSPVMSKHFKTLTTTFSDPGEFISDDPTEMYFPEIDTPCDLSPTDQCEYLDAEPEQCIHCGRKTG